MRTTQTFDQRSALRPAQRRLSAAQTGPGLRRVARRSTLQKAAKADIITAALGATAIVLSLLVLGLA